MDEAILARDSERDTATDHVEIRAANNFAGVSDRGLKHIDNEDSLAMTTVEILVSPVDVPPIYTAVVCDGVSSSEAGASASAVAAKTALKHLTNELNRNPNADARKILHDAVFHSHTAVCAMTHDRSGPSDPPATTIVAAVVAEGFATISWVGDSRAYWVTDTEAGVLTRDHSWINAMIDAGRMTEEEARTSANQHALFRCLGGEIDEDDDPLQPGHATYSMAPGTRLILCTDGFWNYAPTPEDVARVVRQTPIDDPLRTAKHLVNFAIVAGGHDNITVAVLAT